MTAGYVIVSSRKYDYFDRCENRIENKGVALKKIQ
jgi:hypothetical protein